MARQQGRPRRGQTFQRQPTNWARTVVDYQVIPAASKLFMLTIVNSNPGINETVRRTRGMISIASDQGLVPETQLGAFGAIVVTDAAAAIGVTAMPDPVSDASDDGWFLWVPFFQTSVTNVNSRQSVEYHFDSKAMRKVPEGFLVAFIATNADDTHGLQIGLGISLLSGRS